MNSGKDYFTSTLVIFTLTITILAIYNYGQPLDIATTIKKSELDKFKGFVLQEDEKATDTLFFLFDYECEYCAEINTNLNYVSSHLDFIHVKYVPLINQTNSHSIINVLKDIVCLENKNKAKILHNKLFNTIQFSDSLQLTSDINTSCIKKTNLSTSLRNNLNVFSNNSLNSVPILVYNNDVYVGYQNVFQLLTIFLFR